MSANLDVVVSLNLAGAFVRFHCAHKHNENSWRIESPARGIGTLYFQGTNEQMRAFAAAILAEVDDRDKVWLGEAASDQRTAVSG